MLFCFMWFVLEEREKNRRRRKSDEVEVSLSLLFPLFSLNNAATRENTREKKKKKQNKKLTLHGLRSPCRIPLECR